MDGTPIDHADHHPMTNGVGPGNPEPTHDKPKGLIPEMFCDRLWVSLLLIFNTASWPLLNTHFSFFFWLLVFGGLHWTLHADQAEVGS